MRSLLSLVFAVMLTALLGGCDASAEEAIYCLAVAEPGIVLFVEDAETAANLAPIATARIQDGDYVETLRGALFDAPGGDPLHLKGAEDRAGVYTLTVDAEGYRPFVLSNVEVRDNACSVTTVNITARLEPIAS
ncbi:MAG: hypothetical protein AAGG50_10580 [Bacteroidota bacterium]